LQGTICKVSRFNFNENIALLSFIQNSLIKGAVLIMSKSLKHAY
jgi:hypothetical protein